MRQTVQEPFPSADEADARLPLTDVVVSQRLESTDEIDLVALRVGVVLEHARAPRSNTNTLAVQCTARRLARWFCGRMRHAHFDDPPHSSDRRRRGRL